MRSARETGFRSILLAIAVTALAACGGPSGASVCEFDCDCTMCPAAGLTDCKAKAKGNELASQELGCSKQYDALIECLDATSVCYLGGVVISRCDVQQNLWDKCMAAGQSK